MEFKTLILFGLILGLVSPSPARDPDQYWILEAATPLRSQPKADGKVKTYLRTGTEVHASKRSGDWIYVASLFGDKDLIGWVSTAMVSETRIDVESLKQQLWRAASNADKIPWLERIVSIKPESTAYLKTLQKAYAETGDTAKAAHYGRELRGTNPIYLARRDGKDMLVVGAIDSTGGFHNLLWYEIEESSGITKFTIANDSSRAIRKKALALRDAFASLAWYWCGSSRAPGGRIRKAMIPRIVPDTKNRDFMMDVDGKATFGISLGASDDLGWGSGSTIFATRPAFQVPVSGVKGPSAAWDSLAWYQKNLLGSTFDSNGVSEIEYTALPEYGYVDIRMRGIPRNGDRPVEQRGVFNDRRRLVWPPERQTTFEEEDARTQTYSRPQWFRFGPDASFPAFIILPFSNHYAPPDFREEEHGASGYQLLRIDGKGLKAFTVRSHSGGC